MLSNYVMENLFGISLLTIIVSLAAGILVAYFLWGRKYHQVLTSESAVIGLRREADELRSKQHRLKTQLSS